MNNWPVCGEKLSKVRRNFKLIKFDTISAQDIRCKDDEFKCDDRLCLSNSKKCDKRRDCSDGTDELNCRK